MNITIPGFSPLYPQMHCTASGEVCQITAGEGEINAAASVMSLALASSTAGRARLDLRKTYFLAAGIAGVNPKLSTLGGVALARFAVQVALQYEIDAREMPQGFDTGYLPYGVNSSLNYPTTQYGTEVMELNVALRDAVLEFARTAKLNDTSGAAAHRALYAVADGDEYEAATKGPEVSACDAATSDVYYSGTLLSETFETTTRIWTNQTETTYCMTAQEDVAVLQALMRAHLWGFVDYTRAIVLRTGVWAGISLLYFPRRGEDLKLIVRTLGSNFDRPPPNVTAFDHLRGEDQNGFEIAIANLYLSGVEIVRGIIRDWNCTYEAGIKPTNYVGDILGSLGGEPDFGLGGQFSGRGACSDGVPEGDSAGVARSLMRTRKKRGAGARRK